MIIGSCRPESLLLRLHFAVLRYLRSLFPLCMNHIVFLFRSQLCVKVDSLLFLHFLLLVPLLLSILMEHLLVIELV